MAPTDGRFYFLNLSSILITLPFLFYPRGKQEQLLPGHSHVSHRNGIGVNLVFMFDVGNDGCDWSRGLLICRALTSLVVMYVLKLSCNVCWNVGSGPTHILTVHCLCFYPRSAKTLLTGRSLLFDNEDSFSTVVNLGRHFKHFK